MNSRTVRWILIALATVVVVVGYLIAPSEPVEHREATPAATSRSAIAESRSVPEPASTRQAAGGVERRVDNVAVKNYDKVVFRGTVDLTESIERIRAGIKHPHRNDGSVFGNREGLLPRQPRGYYREYVHPTRGVSGAGPQRLVVGRGGDWWYTPDHYASFIPLGTETR